MKLMEKIKEFNRDLESIAIASLNQRANGLKRAYEDGTLKYLLIGGAVTGAGLIYAGSEYNNEQMAGIGAGMLVMDLILGIAAYGNLLLKRTKQNKEEQ